MKCAGQETFEVKQPSCVIVLSMRHVRLLAIYLLLCTTLAPAQVIEFESGGLIYQTLTRNGLTLLALTSYLFYLNWKLTLIVAAVFPAVAWVMRVLTRRLHLLTKANQETANPR